MYRERWTSFRIGHCNKGIDAFATWFGVRLGRIWMRCQLFLENIALCFLIDFEIQETNDSIFKQSIQQYILSVHCITTLHPRHGQHTLHVLHIVKATNRIRLCSVEQTDQSIVISHHEPIQNPRTELMQHLAQNMLKKQVEIKE